MYEYTKLNHEVYFHLSSSHMISDVEDKPKPWRRITESTSSDDQLPQEAFNLDSLNLAVRKTPVSAAASDFTFKAKKQKSSAHRYDIENLMDEDDEDEDDEDTSRVGTPMYVLYLMSMISSFSGGCHCMNVYTICMVVIGHHQRDGLRMHSSKYERSRESEPTLEVYIHTYINTYIHACVFINSFIHKY